MLHVLADRISASHRAGRQVPDHGGQDALATYTFNTGTAKHLFCATCGIKPFYVPRSHPDGFSVNARCIDSPTVTGMKIHAVDGRNWEQHYPAGRGEFTA